jgi:hypothetical protein
MYLSGIPGNPCIRSRIQVGGLKKSGHQVKEDLCGNATKLYWEEKMEFF